MNKKLVLTLSITALVALIIGVGLGRIASGEPPKGEHNHVETTAQEAVDDATEPTIWTCSMHPQIQQSEPGNCPICGMKLIPLVKDSGADEGERVLSMSEASRALADIQTSLVKQDYPEAEIRLVGRLDYDETREKSLTARFPARIDKLFVNFTGIRVKAGEHLAEVYSPELLTAQRELLTAYRDNPDSSITNAAREKLRLWDLLPDQIDEILKNGEAQDHFVLRAPVGGVVVSKNVKEGDYVKTGEPLFKIVDLSLLWAYLDAYESDLPWLRYGQDVSFTLEAIPGETFHGKIAFIEPELDRKTRTVTVRVNVPNQKEQMKPGMFLRGIVKSRLAENGKVYAPEFEGKWISPMHPEIVKDGPGQCDICGMDLVPAETLGYVSGTKEKAPTIVPASAVLRTGKRAVVYVRKPDTERPTYEGREIVLGPRAGDFYLVAAGLSAGERVVTNGAFKIDSALQIQAKPSMMNPEGGGPKPGHHHGGDTGAMNDQSQPAGMSMLMISPEIAPQLIKPYLAMQTALAGDDLDGAKAQAKAMMQITGHSGALPELLHHMLDADTLDSIRVPAFKKLSIALITVLREHPDVLENQLMVMHCPMADENRGADWLQASDPLKNPYYGAMMLTCGETTETLGSKEEGQ